MQWIYILKCEDNIYYVGQTSRLYRRFWEHQDGKGGLNTSIYTPEKVVAIYKVSNIIKFIDYNKQIININNDENLKRSYYTGFNNPKYVLNNWDDIDSVGNDDKQTASNTSENNIAECMMLHNKDNWENIKGGKYVRFDCKYKFPTNEYIKELPLCNCGLPCDVKKHENKEYIFFRCAKKNMWKKFKDEFEIEDEPCKFYREYLTDIELRIEEKKNFDERRKKFGELMKNSFWLENVPCEEDGVLGECVLCNTYVWCDRQGEFKNNGITYHNIRRLLCFDCFINKNEELKKKYDIFNNGKCFINRRFKCSNV
jgi:predicted GIY-YIG superfamily endonuclease